MIKNKKHKKACRGSFGTGIKRKSTGVANSFRRDNAQPPTVECCDSHSHNESPTSEKHSCSESHSSCSHASDEKDIIVIKRARTKGQIRNSANVGGPPKHTFEKKKTLGKLSESSIEQSFESNNFSHLEEKPLA